MGSTMEDQLEFDFERDVQKKLPKITAEDMVISDPSQLGSFRIGNHKHRIIVCSYWLEGLCHSGEQCSFLHRLDKSKMPLCKNGKLCKKNNCPLKHVDDGEIEECLFYKQGFCYNGPKCGRRHIKRLPEECPDEVSFDPVGAGGNLMSSKKSKGNQPNDNYKVTLCTHWLLTNSCHFNEDCHFAHGELEINVGSQASPDFFRDADIYDPTAFAMTEQLELPFATTSRVSYFILQSPDLRSLSVAKRRGVWAVSNRIANDINDAYRTSDHVVFFFSVRPLRGIYGVAKLAGPIPVDPNFQSPMSPEFPIKWLRSIRLSLRSVAQLKLGMTGMFIGRCSTDGRFEKKVGLDMLLTTFHKPEWNWDLELERAERNIRLREADNGGILIGANMPEYYPVNGLAAYYLPPDVLFAPDWYERALIAPPEKGVSGGFARPRKSFEGGFSRNSFTPQGDFYSGEQPGFVFSATPPIIEEMLARGLFGLPIELKDAAVIHPKVPLFILDTQAQVLLGIFYAEGTLVRNMEPQAFINWLPPIPGGGSPLPLQCRFSIALECPPIAMMDPEMQIAIGGKGGVVGQIGPKETKAIANVFARRVGQMIGPDTKGPRLEQHGSSYYKPPFKNVTVAPIDIQGNVFEIKKRLLGHNASVVMGIVEECGPKNAARIRMRGIGSGFYEGPEHKELPEPLHFNISAENPELLQAVVNRVTALIAQVKSEWRGN